MNTLAKHLVAITALIPAMFAGATSSTELTDDAVASVGTSTAAATYYTDLQEAFTALAKGTETANYKLTVLKDVTLSKGLLLADTAEPTGFMPTPYSGANVRYAWFLVDLGGCTISLTNGEAPVLSFVGKNTYSSLLVKNGALKAVGTTPGAFKGEIGWTLLDGVEMSSASAAPTCLFGTTARHGLLRNCSAKNEFASGVAIEYDCISGLINSCEITSAGTAVLSDQRYVKAGGLAIAKSTLSAPTAVEAADTTEQDVYLTGGTFTGALKDDYGFINICGGTYTANPTEFVGSGYKVVENAGIYTVSDAAAVKVDGVDSDMASAFNLAGVTTRTIKLNGDVFLIGLEEKKDLIAIGENQEITIDLNGHDINIFDVSASFSNVNCGSVKKNGVLTLTDSSGKDSGRLLFAAWEPDSRQVPGYANNMFTLSNTSTFTVESGIVECITLSKAGWGTATYCVDNGSGAQSTLNITGGQLINSNTAIRMFYGNTAKLVMTDGEVYGGNSALWVQGGKVDVSITGGKITGLVNSGSYGAIYTTETPSGKLILGGTMEYTGGLRCFATGNQEFCEITGGSFVDDGTKYFLYGNEGGNVVKITGGVFDPCYMKYRNYMKYWTGYEGYYLNVVGPIRIEEDERYHFGEPVAKLLDDDWTAYPYSEEQENVFEAFSSLPLALSHAGESMYVAQENVMLTGRRAQLVADDPDAQPHGFAYAGDFEVYLNGHTVSSTSTDPLIVLASENETTLKFMDNGTIQSAGPVLSALSLGNKNLGTAEIRDGLFRTSGEKLFDLTTAQLKVPANTAAEGEIFDLNRAGFSHDSSAYVVSDAGMTPFVTRQAKTDSNWYLARSLKAE